jgi:Na+-translocating ferredoxin:NAD+ oxidoreductase RnfE subunit
LSEHHSKAVSSNGIFRPVIVVNGQVVGLWKKSATKKSPVQFDFFEQPDAATRNLAEKAAEGFKLHFS